MWQQDVVKEHVDGVEMVKCMRNMAAAVEISLPDFLRV